MPKITLGTETYEIEKLTVGQLRDAELLLNEKRVEAVKLFAPPPGGGTPESEEDNAAFQYEFAKFTWDRWIKVVRIGLSKSLPGLTEEMLLDMYVDADQIKAAHDSILQLAGFRFVPAGEDAPAGVTTKA